MEVGFARSPVRGCNAVRDSLMKYDRGTFLRATRDPDAREAARTQKSLDIGIGAQLAENWPMEITIRRASRVSGQHRIRELDDAVIEHFG